MKIITLGTGNAFTSNGRANASVLLDGTFKILFDCSPQTIQLLRKLNLAPNQIDYIFISHLHGDHSGGLPFFLLNLKHRESGTVTVSGPPGLEKQIHTVYTEYFGDIDMNKFFKFQNLDSKYPFNLEYIEGDHSILDFIYKIEYDNKTIVYTGDTRPVDLSNFANNADYLIHEAGELSSDLANISAHTTPIQAAKIAKEANVKNLILIHRPNFDQKLIDEIHSIFPNTLMPNDLDIIE
tara:strand:+ start:4115 stop:4828 length:714 start_codon:yes stop_codon:yes gene_type:complete